MKINIKTFLFAAVLSAAMLCSSCEDEISGRTFFPDEEVVLNGFDQWLRTNYLFQYNISVEYRLKDAESSFDYDLAPAKVENSTRMAILMKHMWLEAWDEAAGPDFMKSHSPKIITLVGTGSPARGTAEGGLKITLFWIDNIEFTSEYLNLTYFKTCNHEFLHNLDMKKRRPTEFDRISESNYISGDYLNQSLATALALGFVSQYARSEPGEDWVETMAWYIALTPEAWAERMATAGTSGAAIINRKLTMAKSYLLDSWDVDLDEVHRIIQRRTTEFDYLDLESINRELWD